MITHSGQEAGAHPWDDSAAGWNDHTQIIHHWLLDATRKMLDEAQIEPGFRVLDIAAGAGDQTLDIGRRVGSNGYVLATDISTRILELAQRNFQAEGFAQIETRVADAQSLELAGANFDAAVCRLGLMFCSEPLAALTCIHAALKPGARFSALVFSGPQSNPCLSIMMRTALQHARSTPQSPFAPGTLMSLGQPSLLQNLLQNAGFIDIQLQSLRAPFHLPTSEHYVDFVRSAGSPIVQILAPLTEAARRDAWADIVTKLNEFSQPTGWVGPHELLLCSAITPANQKK